MSTPPPPLRPLNSSPPEGSRLKKPLLARFSPPQLIAFSFAVTILIGGLLLWMPITHGLNPDGTRRSVNFLQALFTATSALCVTGLNVIDPSKDFNRLGHTIILLLIQIGGLGIITFGTSFALLTRRRVAFSERVRVAQQVSALSAGDVLGLIRNIFLYTFLIELIGMVLLAFRFVPMHGWGTGLYYALFHSVSGFNNAGFALYSDNLTQFVGDPLVSLVIPALILLGGMGFLVQLNVVAHLLQPRRHRLMVHSKLVLTMMTALFLIGIGSYLFFEWHNPKTLEPLNFGTKLLAAIFHSATLRTAGFNTQDYGAMTMPTIFVSIVLMFIGANPGGTGGGIKTSTFYVMMASAWSMVRGRRDNNLFGRRIDTETTLRAMTVGLLSLGLVNGMFLLLLFFNTDPNIQFVNLFFEAVSAFGTVGLSMDTTPLLHPDQHIVLILLMYLGRIGPLTFAVAFNRPRGEELVRYPSEKDILIG